MSTTFIGLLAAACALGVLLLNLNLRSAWPWQVKLSAILATSGLLVVVYFSLLALLGWPAAGPLPERFQLVAADIHEPDKRTRGEGAIFIWARSLDEERRDPRAYRLPYSTDLHRRLTAAMDEMRNGSRQIGTANSRSGGGPRDRQSIEIRFHALRSTGLPEKRRR